MTIKHTPGPWKSLGLLSPFGWVIKYDGSDGKESIAYIQAYDIEDDDPEPYGEWSDENKANHDLVLAAPDLLEALLSFVNHGTCFDELDMSKARAAINKATGKS
jgi:hypothetical protein